VLIHFDGCSRPSDLFPGIRHPHVCYFQAGQLHSLVEDYRRGVKDIPKICTEMKDRIGRPLAPCPSRVWPYRENPRIDSCRPQLRSPRPVNPLIEDTVVR
jgi:hypothetical protein